MASFSRGVALPKGAFAPAVTLGEQVKCTMKLFRLRQMHGHVEQRYNGALVLLSQNSALSCVTLLIQLQSTVASFKTAITRSELREK